MTSWELPVAARGLLADFAAAGMICPVDFHLARRIASLAGEADEQVILAFALAARELRLGSVCLDLEHAAELRPESELTGGQFEAELKLSWPDPRGWVAKVRASPAVGGPDLPGHPFRLESTRLYLGRYYEQERIVANRLAARSALPTLAETAQLQPTGSLDELQSRAVQAALSSRTTVITGGPGTGKTTIVANLLKALGSRTRVALAAPTGKAAARLEAAAQAALPSGMTLICSTLHKLLGLRPGEDASEPDPGSTLPYDLIVVDETSMVSLTQMAALLTATADSTRLVLIGDPDQLASVEAGAVLADISRSRDLVCAPSGSQVQLLRNYRSNQAIAELATKIQRGDASGCLDLFTSDGPCRLIEAPESMSLAALPKLAADALETAQDIQAAASAGDGAAALRALDSHRVLCAHREGRYGVSHWQYLLRSWLRSQLSAYGADTGPYVGQPLLITRNTDLARNGDVAVIVRREGSLQACLDLASGERYLEVGLLPEHTELQAMTIHKSQGSQFQRVSVILPPVSSPLLTRELLYTALTRARDEVSIYGTAEAVRQAVKTPARRASGLGL